MARTRRLTAQESHLLTKHADVAGLAMLNRRGSQVFTHAQLNRVFEAERAEQQSKLQASMADDSTYYTSAEFRQEVIDELCANGATLEQATNRTRDTARLFAEARELKLM